MILILATEISPRLQYTAEVIFKHFSGLNYQLTDNKEEFLGSDKEKINYTPDFIEGIPWIIPHGLLTEKGIRELKIDSKLYQGIPVLFPVTDERAKLPFDLFSAVFYMLSRYEEYLPFNADKYGRFPATESIAWKKGFLHIPVVDHWVNFLTAQIEKREFRFNSTIDIDVAFAYKHKGIKRNLGGFFQSLFKGDFQGSFERLKVISGLQSDPYDTYDFIRKVHEDNYIRPHFFILFADYGENDKNLSPKNKKFHQLIQHLDDFGDVGIHPSFASSHHHEKIKQEISGLSKVLGRTVTHSRQHFLLLSLPETYRRIIECGIQEDYSMGYADNCGFRAGTCTAFPFFDLATEEMTSLMIYPFAIMEGTLKDYLELSPEQGLVKIKELINEVKKVRGTYITIWHNESLSDKKRWTGWRKVYLEMFTEALNRK